MLKHVAMSEYKGHAMLVFSSGEGDRQPFQFGAMKASKLIHAMAENGIEPILNALVEMASDFDSADAEKVKHMIQDHDWNLPSTKRVVG